MQVANLNDIAIAGHTWREVKMILPRAEMTASNHNARPCAANFAG